MLSCFAQYIKYKVFLLSSYDTVFTIIRPAHHNRCFPLTELNVEFFAKCYNNYLSPHMLNDNVADLIMTKPSLSPETEPRAFQTGQN